MKVETKIDTTMIVSPLTITNAAIEDRADAMVKQWMLEAQAAHDMVIVHPTPMPVLDDEDAPDIPRLIANRFDRAVTGPTDPQAYRDTVFHRAIRDLAVADKVAIAAPRGQTDHFTRGVFAAALVRGIQVIIPEGGEAFDSVANDLRGLTEEEGQAARESRNPLADLMQHLQ